MATFGTLSDRLAETFKNLRTKGKLSRADVDGTVREIRRALLDADVALDVVKEFTAHVRERALGDEVNKALNPAQQVVQIVNEELVAILGGEQRRLQFAKNPPTVIMLAGLQGAGKTTLAGKLAKWLEKDGHTPLLVAADLQRPNAVNQLQVVGEQAGVPVFAPEPGNGVGDPVKVAKDAVKHAERAQHDVVIIDTAGRLGVDAEMMKQAADIRKATNPDEVLFVIDAMIGQDAVTTAKAFQEGVDFTGVVLSKLDGDARGGAALSRGLRHRPPDHLRVHRRGPRRLRAVPPRPHGEPHPRPRRHPHPHRAGAVGLRRGRGDEGRREVRDRHVHARGLPRPDAAAARSMGSIKKMLGMLPGAGGMKQQLENFDEREIVRTEAIIQSMTPAERAQPEAPQRLAAPAHRARARA